MERRVLSLKRTDFPSLSDEQFYILRRQYCEAMHKLEKCTIACTNCQETLTAIIEKVKTFENPRNPAAILTWCIQDKIAEIKEQGEVQKASPVNWLGELIKDNPFEMFLKTMK